MKDSTETSAKKIATDLIGGDGGGDGGAVVALDSLALIEVTGDDAQEFLQGQFSNDIDAIGPIGDTASAPAACQLNAYCNPKGRALAVVRVLRLPESWWLLAPRALAEALIKRLRMFVLRAKVGIEMRPLIRRGAINAPDLKEAASNNDGVVCVDVAGIVPRQLIIGEAARMAAFARAEQIPPGSPESTESPESGDDKWRLVDILSGIAQVYPATAEAFIPQFINLDRAGGLSFSKGCYPGQEIIARLRYRGRVKQRMVAARARGVDALAPGDPVCAAGSDQKIGMVVDAAPSGRREYIFSATVPAPLGDTAIQVGRDSTVTRIQLPTDTADGDGDGEK